MSLERLKLTKKQIVVVTSILVVILLVAIFLVSLRSARVKKSQPVAKKPIRLVAETPKAPEAYDRLSGLPTTTEMAARRPIAVMIENYYPDSRPQSGLDKASIIFETVAEGGITRFLAVYETGDAEVVGPIRSNREYYVSWAKSLGAVYVHIGGSPGGYDAIYSLGVDNIDAIGWSTGFWRSRERYAPHNLYSTTKNLREQAAAKGYRTAATMPGYGFKDDIPPSARPAAQSATVDFSDPAYLVKYVYQRDSNSYLRYLGGKPHVDAVTGKQLVVKNIAVMYTRIWPLYDEEKRMGVETTGGGDAVIVQDGTIIAGTWKRPSANEPVRFYDKSGQEIKFNRGQTWIEATDKPIKAE
ncbi:MAG: DUF3048 domain-containing protein [Actinobacteria bacterium]|nr:DUF3048 domain-containing protein [Actinomycetota bacterium]